LQKSGTGLIHQCKYHNDSYSYIIRNLQRKTNCRHFQILASGFSLNLKKMECFFSSFRLLEWRTRYLLSLDQTTELTATQQTSISTLAGMDYLLMQMPEVLNAAKNSSANIRTTSFTNRSLSAKKFRGKILIS